MKQLSSEKYNLAWYRLAEFVARKEKERALGLLRLLTHGFEDQALKYQLEGDLLLSFDDPNAADRYYQAAQLYKKDGKAVDAISLFEQLKTLEPENSTYPIELLAYYHAIYDQKRVMATMIELLPQLLAKKQLTQMQTLFHEYIDQLDDMYRGCAYHCAVLAMIKKEVAQDIIAGYLKMTLSLLQDNQHKLYAFLDELKRADSAWHELAEDYLLKS